MAQVLAAQTQAAVGPSVSPMSGGESPSIVGGEKITRTQAKKIFGDEVSELIQGVKAIDTYANALAVMKKGVPMQVTFIDSQGQPRQYQIGRNEYRELVSQVTKRMQKLTSLAFTLNKTRRRTGPTSGFLAPQQFNQDIVNFFSQAELGPQVAGELILKTDKAMNKKAVPEGSTLQVVPDTRLNTSLFFTMPQINGQPNPLYGIIAPGTLTPLFALHANYAQNPALARQGLQAAARDWNTQQVITNPQTGQPEIDATRLTASAQMRQILGNIMRQTIMNDARAIAANPKTAHLRLEAEAKAQQLLAAVDNPSLYVDSRVGLGTPNETEMFNPNYFLYAHFSKLISNGKVAAEQGGLTPERLAQLRPQISTVYGPLLQRAVQYWQTRVTNGSPESRELAKLRVSLLQEAIRQVPEQGVLTYQQDDVSKSRAYKTLVQGAITRRRAAEKKQAQAAAAAALPMGQGLPGGAVVGQQNIYGGGSPSGSRSGSRV